LRYKFSSPQEFGAMVPGLGNAISLEVGQSAISCAVGMAHHEHALALVQPDRHADLLQNEVLLESVARGGKRFSPSGHDDHVRIFNALFLQKLADNSIDAMVETGEHRCLGDVRSVS